MAATVKAAKSYDLSGGALREDLQDMIYDISPQDTYCLTSFGRGTARSTTHEWLTDVLGAAGANVGVEGDAFSAQTRNLPSRLKNYTQISKKEFEVTGTAQKINTAGMRELMAYHTARAAKEIKRDIEYSLLNNNPASAGTSTSGRVSAGIANWVYEGQHYKIAAQTAQTTTAPVSGFATATGGSWTNSATAYSETELKGMLALAWSAGGEVDTIVCDSVAFNKFSAFTGVAQRFRDVASKQAAQIIGYADVYVSPYGVHKLVLSRYIMANTAFALQTDTWDVAYLRPFQTVEIAKVGDAERRAIIVEWTLVAKTPVANAKAHGVA